MLQHLRLNLSYPDQCQQFAGIYLLGPALRVYQGGHQLGYFAACTRVPQGKDNSMGGPYNQPAKSLQAFIACLIS